jgi:NADPH:quinone reductase
MRTRDEGGVYRAGRAAREHPYGELPTPTLRPGDVLVRVTAVCVDPVDCLVRSGRLPTELPFPFIVGRDMAGVVESVGPAVTRFAPGQRVWCNNQGHHGRQGTFAERVAVEEALLYPVPAGADDKQVAAVAHSGLTAHLGLRRGASAPRSCNWPAPAAPAVFLRQGLPKG